jgi:hypothetical protein
MPIKPDSPAFKELMLQIETDLLALARLRMLLAEDDETGLRRELRRCQPSTAGPRNRLDGSPVD